MAAAELHPAASHDMPSFITAPGETDVLMVITAIVLAGSVVAFGILFLRLHSLPEHMAHGAKKAQLEIVSVLCLIALFTHIHAFWIVALLLAMIDLPDFPGWLGRITAAVERIAGAKPADTATQHDTVVSAKDEAPAASTQESAGRSAKKMEPTHA
jgi:NADH:ubiquinone oxidoreductase subunit 5 (subunit L)/multisubunit Na+/H+ antiporter MnhA subunit